MFRSSFALRFFLISFVCVLFVFAAVHAFANESYDATISLTIGNSAPTISSLIYVNSGDPGEPYYPDVFNASSSVIPLNAGAATNIHVMGTVTDANGIGTDMEQEGNGDILQVLVIAYEDSTDMETCAGSVIAETPDGYTCNGAGFLRTDADVVTFNTCTFSYSSATEAAFDCVIPFSFRSKATPDFVTPEADAWHVVAAVFDRGEEMDISDPVTVGVGETLGLAFPSTLSYGVIQPGETRAEPVTYVISQGGNVAAGVRVSGTDLTCAVNGLGIGSIPLANQRFALSGATVYGSATVLTNDLESAEALTGLTVSAPTTSVTNASLYWNLLMPASGVGGVCSGTTTLLAIPSV